MDSHNRTNGSPAPNQKHWKKAAIVLAVLLAAFAIWKLIPAEESSVIVSSDKLAIPELIVALEKNMKTISGGEFTMGCTEEQISCYDHEKPSHSVKVASFSLNKYEVTQEEWRAVMGRYPREMNFNGCDKCPVDRVSWNDVQDFLEKLNKITEKKYRLPSESEWEFAARGGNQSKGFQYAGSAEFSEVAWFHDNSDNKMHPVGEKKPNELGLYDMSGNVWEWCEDKWHKDYQGAPSDGSVWIEKGNNHVIRGGTFSLKADYSRVSSRYEWLTEGIFGDAGFRLALSL